MNAINGGENKDKNLHEIEAELESIKENYNDPLSECLFFQLSSMIAHVKKIADKMERDLIELPGEIRSCFEIAQHNLPSIIFIIASRTIFSAVPVKIS